MAGRGIVSDLWNEKTPELIDGAGYNECGTHAGIHTAYYVNTGKEPVMYDPEYDSLYLP